MTAKPKIGIYVQSFPRSSETFIVTKILGLLALGFDITIFANSQAGDWDKFAVLNDRPDVRARMVYGPKRPTRVGTGLAAVRMFAEKSVRHPASLIAMLHTTWAERAVLPIPVWAAILFRLPLVGHPLDILHIEFDVQGVALVGMKNLLGAKVLLSGRGEHRRNTLVDAYPLAMRYLFDHADGYHFISAALHRSALEAGLSPSLPIWFIQPAIDLRLFSPRVADASRSAPAPTNDTPLLIVSVGRLAWAKGYEFALDAVALLVARGVPVRYVILGDGSYEQAILYAAKQNGLLHDEIVTFAGYVPREGVVAYYARADIMLHAAVEEGFCNAVIEAQALEVPVVTSDAGGLPENVEHGVTGLVVPRRDAKALADGMERLWRDPNLRRQMGAAGRERALRLYDIDQQVQAFAQLYQTLGETSSSPTINQGGQSR